MKLKIIRIAAAAIGIASFQLPAQPAAGPAFEVASIRPHTGPLRTIMGLTISGTRVSMEGYTVSQLIMEAYGLRGTWQLRLAPVRGRDDFLNIYYDVAGRASGSAPTRSEVREMLRSLLSERFRLSVHREVGEMPVYALVPGKNGPKLGEGNGDGACSVNVGAATGGQRYSFSNCTIDSLVDMLGNGLVDRPVVDKTQLTGKYTFRLVAMPDFMNRNQSGPDDVSPFTAIEDLGLRLQAQTAPIGIIVVDHVEKPSEN